MNRPIPPDPFDHSNCDHEQPVFPVLISPKLEIDLVGYLHAVWLAVAHSQPDIALKLLDDLGRWVEMAAMGYEDEVDGEVERAKATSDEIRTLRDPKAFDEELRKLLEGNQ